MTSSKAAQRELKQEAFDRIADHLLVKGREVIAGQYGDDDDGDKPGCTAKWIGDLFMAAGLLQAGTIDKLTDDHVEEIECCSDADGGDVDVLLAAIAAAEGGTS